MISAYAWTAYIYQWNIRRNSLLSFAREVPVIHDLFFYSLSEHNSFIAPKAINGGVHPYVPHIALASTGKNLRLPYSKWQLLVQSLLYSFLSIYRLTHQSSVTVVTRSPVSSVLLDCLFYSLPTGVYDRMIDIRYGQRAFVHCVRKVALYVWKVLEAMSTSVYIGLNPFSFIRKHFLQICLWDIS
jgi:hypothetical protein